jgi:8-oxo-dGTP pyrophosphatase MutT (NUDIX family)
MDGVGRAAAEYSTRVQQPCPPNRNARNRHGLLDVLRDHTNASQCAIRETLEETGVLVEILGLVGIYSDPGHIVAYTDGEIRQEYEVTLLARPVSGTPAANDEAGEAGWFCPDRLAELDIHPTMRRQIDDHLTNRAPHVD